MNRKSLFLVLVFSGCSGGDFTASAPAPSRSKGQTLKAASAEQMAKEERVSSREVIESGTPDSIPANIPSLIASTVPTTLPTSAPTSSPTMAPTNPPATPAATPAVRVNCDTPSSLSTATVTVLIPKNDPTNGGSRCPFGTGDNNSANSNNGGEYSARIERTFPINIPSSHAVCAMTAQSQSQTLKYDDHIFLMINNYVLLATKGIPTERFTLDANGFYVYDWSQIRGRNIRTSQACASGVTCQFPASEQSGNFSFQLNSDANKRLFSSLQNQNLSFKIVLTGDDNPDIDCRQSKDLNLSVTYTYFTR